MLPESDLRVLLIGGVETRFHHFDDLAPVLQRTLSEAGHLVTRLLAAQAFYPEILRRFDAIVSITTAGVLDSEQEQALLGAVRERRNDQERALHFLGLHGASCSFTDSRAYLEMLGGRFTHHPPMAEFAVESLAPAHPITRGMQPFRIYDELYHLELCAPVELLLGSPVPGTNAPMPLGWARPYGAGKVVYFALGHGPEQLAHPGVRGLITSTLRWFADP